MKITAQDLVKLGVVDEIVMEPIGGAHREPVQVINAAGDAIDKVLKNFDDMSPEAIRQHRREKFLAVGRTL